MIYFESPRLVFNDWKEECLADFRNMNRDSQVMEYFPKILSDDETDGFYQKIQEEFKEYRYGLYAVITKERNEFIGFHWATLRLEFAPFIEIGWRLKKEAWGKGYATEGAKECLAYGFNHLGFNELYSFTSVLNTRSENVMKKIGMTRKMEFNHPQIDLSSSLCKHILYHITSLQYDNNAK